MEDIMQRTIFYKNKKYKGGHCPQCGKTDISFCGAVVGAEKGNACVCNFCKNWEWVDDAVDSVFMELIS